jgi:dephospho-CoA kinase
VAKILVESGARLVDADRLGHQVLEDPRVRSELAQAFGPQVLGPEGRVRKDELGRRAFADAPSLARLNAISHPRLLTLLRSALMGFAAAGVRGLVVLEAALLVEWDLGAWCDEVVVVTAPRELRAERARAQRGLSAGEGGGAAAAPATRRHSECVMLTASWSTTALPMLAQAARELADSLRAAWQSRERATH